MKTITLVKPGTLELSDTALPGKPGPGEALVRVHRVGMCGTDLHAFKGDQPFFNYPRILGHELGVVVEAVGEGVTTVSPGDRCAVEPYLNCGHCIACRRGKSNCCMTLRCLGVHTDGGMRERIVLPAHKLHPGNQLSLDQLALVETLGIGAHAVARAQPQKGEFVLVIGAGPIGLAVTQYAVLAGCRVILTDVNESRLDFAKRHAGVEHAISAEVDPLRAILSVTNNDGPTVVFDATGSLKSMNRSFRYVAPGGKLVFVGLVNADVTFSDPEFHRRELTLLATRNSLPQDFRNIIARVERGEIDTTPWITHRCSCTEAVGEFPKFLEPANKCVKAIIEF
jgi:2-desacetyl-2-hydroxyethyl bacteriochlorophyllide A dehydrogenase